MPSPRSPHSSVKGCAPSGRSVLLGKGGVSIPPRATPGTEDASLSTGPLERPPAPAPSPPSAVPDFSLPCPIHNQPFRRVTYGRGGWRCSGCRAEWRLREDGEVELVKD